MHVRWLTANKYLIYFSVKNNEKMQPSKPSFRENDFPKKR